MPAHCVNWQLILGNKGPRKRVMRKVWIVKWSIGFGLHFIDFVDYSICLVGFKYLFCIIFVVAAAVQQRAANRLLLDAAIPCQIQLRCLIVL